MGFLADAFILGGQFNSSNFIADFGYSTEKLAECYKELQVSETLIRA